MTPDHSLITELRGWYERYIDGFYARYPEKRSDFKLKDDHTLRVCVEMELLGKELCMSETDLILAQIIALFHDIGRFEQIARFGTLVDSKSVNHAVLGVQLLREYGVLEELEQETQVVVLGAISYHNLPSLPADGPERVLFFCKLLRDADKLDIYHIATGYYSGSSFLDDVDVKILLPDTPGITEDIYRDLLQRKSVSYTRLRTLNDFKLLQMNWVYDINFAPSLRAVARRGYIDTIYGTLPRCEQTQRIYDAVKKHLDA
jgi:putative nucleotidyltransferase with HDIG domain